MLEARERDTGQHHEGGAQQHHVAKIVPRRNQADEQSEHGSTEEGSRRDKPDRNRAEADGRQISRQDDHREAVAEPAQTSCGVEQIDVRAWWRHDGSNRKKHHQRRMVAQKPSPPLPCGGGLARGRLRHVIAVEVPLPSPPPQAGEEQEWSEYLIGPKVSFSRSRSCRARPATPWQV